MEKEESFADLLTIIHWSAYNEIKWEIYASEEYESWFETLALDSKEAVLERVLLLEIYGPTLPRPYTDVLKGSKLYKNLKELRAQTDRHVLRVAYYFDSKRKAFLLTGGDKKGKDQKKFYKDLIAESEAIIEKHEKDSLLQTLQRASGSALMKKRMKTQPAGKSGLNPANLMEKFFL